MTFLATQLAYLKTAHINSTNPGFKVGSCPSSSDGKLYSWHFVLPDSSSAFISINCTFKQAGTNTKMIQVPTAKHAYVYTPTPDMLLGAWATVSGVDAWFVLSHVCNPESKCENHHLFVPIHHGCFFR